MKVAAKIISRWTTLRSTYGNWLSLIFCFLLFGRLFFAYNDTLPTWLLLIFDIVVSILAIVFTWEQVEFLMKGHPFLFNCAASIIALPFFACLYGIAIGNDIAGISEYLGLYSAYLGVSTCFLQSFHQKTNKT